MLSLSVIEALILSLISITWLTSQSLIFCAQAVDGCIFYSQFLILLVILLVTTFLEDESLRRVFYNVGFTMNLALFLAYCHLMDLSYNYTNPPAVPSCTTTPHSSYAYRQLFFCKAPMEITMVLQGVSLANLVLILLTSASFNALDLWTCTHWIDITLLVVLLHHVYVALNDPLVFVSYLLVFALVLHFLTFACVALANCLVSDKLAMMILEIVHLVVIAVSFLALFLFQLVHTQSTLLYSYYFLLFWAGLFLVIHEILLFAKWKEASVVLLHQPWRPNSVVFFAKNE